MSLDRTSALYRTGWGIEAKEVVGGPVRREDMYVRRSIGTVRIADSAAVERRATSAWPLPSCPAEDRVDMPLLPRIVMMKDPVCGMMVDEKKTKLVSQHDGVAFYFCSVACKSSFDRDPHKYGHVH
jgi:YHS domain-containing protein